MPQLKTRCLLLAALALAATPSFAGQALAAPQDQAAPQGEDPPGADDSATDLPPEQNGVIPPPDIGDEDIQTEVPNPHAGHEEEVIPPPATKDAEPDAPRVEMPRNAPPH